MRRTHLRLLVLLLLVSTVCASSVVIAGEPERTRQSSLDDQGWDDFGYFYVDNRGDTATYSWIELRGDPNATWVDTWTDYDESCAESCPIGFAFPFYGTWFTSFRPVTNGQIEFAECGVNGTGGCPPYIHWGTAILPYVFDLNLIAGGNHDGNNVVGYRNFGDYTVIEYDSVGYNFVIQDSVSLKFEAILFSDGRIKFQYNNIVIDYPPMGAIGIQTFVQSAWVGLHYRCSSDDNTVNPVTNGLAIWFAPLPNIPMPVSNLQGQANGTTVTLTWTDPSEDIYGNPITPDSIVIYRDGFQTGQRVGWVLPGVQTIVLPNQVPGAPWYYFRAYKGYAHSSWASVTLFVTQPAYYQNFDVTDGAWVADNGVWQWGPVTNPNGPAPHSGSNVWGTGLNSYYPNYVCSHLDLNFGLPVIASNARVDFWLWYESQFNDACNLKVSTDNGTTWTVVEPVGNYPVWEYGAWRCGGMEHAWAGWGDGDWHHVIIPIGQFLGQTPVFRFTFGSDAMMNLTNPGFFFDDFGVWGLELPPVRGFVTLAEPGPPDWAYTLHQVSGIVNHFVFTGFCEGTTGSVSGDAQAQGWTAHNYSDSIVFFTPSGLYAGSIGTFWLHHPTCNDQVQWNVGDSSGFVDDPLPVELTSFDVAATERGVRVSFVTASETYNDHFEIFRSERNDADFRQIADIATQGNSPAGHHYEYADLQLLAGQTYWYYLVDVDVNGNRTEHRDWMRSATVPKVVLPLEYSLSVFPNPFNPGTTISFSLKEAGRVSLCVYDVSGRMVRSLTDATFTAGEHQLGFDASDLPSGIYFAHIQSGSFTASKKLMLLK